MSSGYTLEMLPAGNHDQVNDEVDTTTKKDLYEPEVRDVEAGERGDTRVNGQVVPPGVDPSLLQSESVHRGLKQRHIQMIALAGAIGTGLFLGSGRSIRRAGPLGTLIGYSAVGFLVICVMACIGETSALAPVSGAYIRHAELFVDPALSFAIGWSTFYGSAVSVPAEWTAVAVLCSYWSDLSPAIWITICIVVTFATNLFFIRIYGEVELISAFLKIALIMGLIIFGLIYDLGGVPGQSRIGFEYWKNPGPFGMGYWQVGTAAGKFSGFWLTFINAVYAYSGVETLAIAAAETQNPRRNIPKAAKRVFIRVTVFYLLSLFVVGLIVPANDPHLAHNNGTASSSPFVVAATKAGVKVLPSIINAVVITSAWSSGNHGMLTGSRSLYALALEGRAPKIFTRVSRFGIPYIAVIFQGSFQLLAYMSLGNGGASEAFSYLTNLNSSSTLVIWITIGICNWRMRKAMRVQGIDAGRLPWASPFQPFVSHVVIWGSGLVLITGGFYSFLPGNWDIADFISSYFAIAFMIVFYFGHKIIRKSKIVPLDKSPVEPFILIADANPEPLPLPKKGPMSWFAKFWWD